MKKDTNGKYIVKIISVPTSQNQLDALLLTGAYHTPADATEYFREQADGIAAEVKTLSSLSAQAGFLPFEGCQVVPMENNQLGYQVYLLSSYKRTLDRLLRRGEITYRNAQDLGLKICAALIACRKAGFLYAALKPSNIFVSEDLDCRIGDLGFMRLTSLNTTPLPDQYRSHYAPPETSDTMHTLDGTIDTYALGMILYQMCNSGALPADASHPVPPAQAGRGLSGIIMKAIDPTPANRWQDPDSMYQALKQCCEPAFSTISGTQVFSAVSTASGEKQTENLSDTRILSRSASSSPAVSSRDTKKLPDPPKTAPVRPQPDYDYEEEAYDDTDYEDEEVIRVLPEKPQEQERRRKPIGKGWIAPVVLLLVAVLLVGVGYYYYQNYYLQTINSLRVEGEHNRITVLVDTAIDEENLEITCTDTYGNTQRSSLSDGVALFTDLKPNSQYKIHLEVNGFHKLVGKTSEVFNTETRTDIISFTAITGAEDGSVMLNFTVDGPEPKEWVISYSAEGEAEKSQHFTGHSVTIKDLTVPKRYSFRLSPSEQMYVAGETSMEYTASKLILAQNLVISSCDGSEMTARWDTPEGSTVNSWTVRCFNESGYEQVLETTENKAVFSDIDTSRASYVEVTADGMTQNVRTSITPNPITIASFKVNEDDPMKLTISWDFRGITPEGGWLLLYTLDGSNTKSVIKVKSDSSAEISPRIPGAEYRFEIQAADATSIFNNLYTYRCPEANSYTDHSFVAEKTTAKLLVTPEAKDWSIADISKDDYTQKFTVGQSISIVLCSSARFFIPEDSISILYVIRNSAGSVDSKLTSEDSADWHDLWVDYNTGYAELNLPTAPTEVGDYTVSIYFNGYFVTTAPFSMEASE